MDSYWLGVVLGLSIGFMCGAVTKEKSVEHNCEKANRIVLDSKVFECKVL